MLDGGAGNDFLDSGGGGSSVITTGSGQDLASFFFRVTDGELDWPDGGALYVDNVVSNFTPGQDQLLIRWRDSIEQSGEDDRLALQLQLSQLDSKADGQVTGADLAVAQSDVTLDGATRASLVIDTGDLHHIDPRIFSTGTITLFGMTSLTASDIAGTTG